jgi:ribonuclease HIII
MSHKINMKCECCVLENATLTLHIGVAIASVLAQRLFIPAMILR